MALGIGATTTFFSLAYGVLLRPLPWPEPDRVVRLQETRGGRAGRIPLTISNTTYHAWRDVPGATIEEIGGWMRGQQMTMTVGSGEPERVRVGHVTPSLLRVLRVHPLAGRTFVDDDAGRAAGPEVILLGFGLWQRRFAGAADIVGRTLRLDDRTVTIVGVMPRDFAFPDRETDAWLPLTIARVEAGGQVIRAMIFNAVARLRPGVSPEQAAGEGTARARGAPQLGLAAVALFGTNDDIAVSAIPARTALTADVRPALMILLGAVALLFLAALASIFVLQSSRAAKRSREMAIRAAIGARGGDLARQCLAESAILGIASGLAALAVSTVLHYALPALLPADFPRAADVQLDRAVIAFAFLITVVASAACGFVPLTQQRTGNLVESLASDSTMPGASAAGRSGRRVRGAMMTLQVSIACVLLVGAALLARSFAALLTADRGFDSHNVLTAHITMKARPFASQSAAVERVQARLQSLPGVAHVAFGNALPYVTTGGFRGLTLPSPTDPAVKIQAQTIVRTVDPEYFPALRLRLVEGRPLNRTDTSSSRPVVVVNRTFAAKYLGPHPVGAVLPFVAGSRREWEVVGIVDDVRQGGLSGVAPSPFGGVADPPQPETFFSYRQWDSPVSELAFVIRAADPEVLAPTLRTILREEDPTVAIDSMMTMEERVMNSLARPRTYAVLVGGFALFSVIIAVVGVFGTISYVSMLRTREIGLRTALGARPRDILQLVTIEAAVVGLLGVAVGVGAAFALARSLGSLIYGISTHDVLTFVTVPAVLIALVAFACALPARRALQVSPIVALRNE
jgi:predicted permease